MNTIVRVVGRNELVTETAEATGYSKKDVQAVMDAVLSRMVEHFISGNRVSIHNFGVFKIVHKEQRTGRNPKTGETITLPARRSVSFSAAKPIKDAMVD